MAANYFNQIDENILIYLLSKMDIDKLRLLEGLSVRLKKTITNEKNYGLMLIIRDKDLYDYIVNEKFITGCSSWMGIYRELILNAGYGENIYFSNIKAKRLVKLDFPAMYEYLRDINMDHVGMGMRLYTVPWNLVYRIFKSLSEYDFVKGKINIQEYLKIITSSNNYFRQPVAYSIISYIYSKHLFRSSETIDENSGTLYNLFLFNLDMYENIVSIIPGDMIKSIIKMGIIDPLKTYIATVYSGVDFLDEYLENLFIDDLRKRL